MSSQSNRPDAPCVLLAEDHDEFRALLASVLRNEGYCVLEACDGLELTSKFMEAVQNQRPPDLIVSDIWMPWTSGLEVIERLRRAQARTPAILISAYADEQRRERADALGRACVLEKPFKLKQLREAAAKMISHV